MHPVPLDEFPIHQTPLSLRYVGSSDRNFYDRAYFNAHDRTGDVFFVTGLGVYPNLGVTDAYATVRRGDRQWTIRCSDALGARPPLARRRAVPRRGPGAAAAHPADLRHATSTASASTSPGRGRSPR